MSNTCRRFLVSLVSAGLLVALPSPPEVRAQGMNQMPGMGGTKQETTASATGTVTAIDCGGSQDYVRSRPDIGDKMAPYENGISGRAVSGSF
jgi:hypothetical protein